MSGAYYNEFDPFAATWLRELIKGGHIAEGDVDERSIVDVRPSDLAGYTQCHFFAGIGGWSRALRLAGVSDLQPLWTGSCPCQPFSAAGKGGGFDDERHLWPDWYWLISQCSPPIVFGEQVEAAIRWGWLDLVFSDLEAIGYVCGSAVLPACSVGAPHIRNRAWFVADRMANAMHSERRPLDVSREDGRDRQDAGRPEARGDAGTRGAVRSVADAEAAEWWRSISTDDGGRRSAQVGGSGPFGFWSDAIWLPCTDGKARPTQSGIFPLAHGIPNRVGTLRGAGNAIVPQVAAEFIRAALG